jgi:hypothetical protein
MSDAITLPAWLTTWLEPLLYVFYVFVALWLVAYWRRRAYNLTPVASARAKGSVPDFLRPQPQFSTPPAEPVRGNNTFGLLSRVGVVLLALANLTIAGAGAIARAGQTHEVFYQLSSLERWQTIIGRYWIGFILAVLVIAVELVRCISTLRAAQAVTLHRE